jgi:hypothetical protein
MFHAQVKFRDRGGARASCGGAHRPSSGGPARCACSRVRALARVVEDECVPSPQARNGGMHAQRRGLNVRRTCGWAVQRGSTPAATLLGSFSLGWPHMRGLSVTTGLQCLLGQAPCDGWSAKRAPKLRSLPLCCAYGCVFVAHVSGQKAPEPGGVRGRMGLSHPTSVLRAGVAERAPCAGAPFAVQLDGDCLLPSISDFTQCAAPCIETCKPRIRVDCRKNFPSTAVRDGLEAAGQHEGRWLAVVIVVRDVVAGGARAR